MQHADNDYLWICATWFKFVSVKTLGQSFFLADFVAVLLLMKNARVCSDPGLPVYSQSRIVACAPESQFNDKKASQVQALQRLRSEARVVEQVDMCHAML